MAPEIPDVFIPRGEVWGGWLMLGARGMKIPE